MNPFESEYFVGTILSRDALSLSDEHIPLLCCQRIIIVIKFCYNFISYLFCCCFFFRYHMRVFLMCPIKSTYTYKALHILNEKKKKNGRIKKRYAKNWNLFCFRVYYIIMWNKKRKRRHTLCLHAWVLDGIDVHRITAFKGKSNKNKPGNWQYQ